MGGMDDFGSGADTGDRAGQTGAAGSTGSDTGDSATADTDTDFGNGGEGNGGEGEGGEGNGPLPFPDLDVADEASRTLGDDVEITADDAAHSTLKETPSSGTKQAAYEQSSFDVKLEGSNAHNDLDITDHAADDDASFKIDPWDDDSDAPWGEWRVSEIDDGAADGFDVDAFD